MADALDAVVVVDFQHTSLTGGGTSEIIEFPWIVFDLATGDAVVIPVGAGRSIRFGGRHAPHHQFGQFQLFDSLLLGQSVKRTLVGAVGGFPTGGVEPLARP